MIDKYIILNRQPKILLYTFCFVTLLLSVIVIYTFNTLTYTSYYSTNSLIVYKDNNYYIKLKVKLENLELLKNKNELLLDDNIYKYRIYKIESNIHINSQNVYLKINNLDNSYKINNYGVKIKIEKNKKKIIHYFKL
jgi:hypothetical protein